MVLDHTSRGKVDEKRVEGHVWSSKRKVLGSNH